MPPTHYSLLDEPWLPMRTTEGDTARVGLRACLCEPHRFKAIDSTHPTETLALYRLMLAIAHRAIGAGRLEDRADLLDEWPRARVAAYLETWAHRFHLRDPVRPFLQVAALAAVEKLKPRPWTLLAPERASGNNRTLFDHTVDRAVPPASDAELARQLMAHLQFVPGGLVKAMRTSGSRGPACSLLCVLVLGASLQQTLVLNLVPQSPTEYGADLAAWEQDEPAISALSAGQEVVPAGPAQRYTFLSRAVWLGPPGAACSEVRAYAEGLALGDSPVPDPMAAQRPSEKGLWPVLLREDRAFWRDLHALSAEGGHPPATVLTALGIRQACADYTPLDLLAGGLLADQAKLLLWRLEERRIAPLLLAGGQQMAAHLHAAIEAAERAARQLDHALWQACRHWLEADPSRPPRKSDVQALALQLGGMPRYWQALEPRFWALADALGQGGAPDAAMQAWAEQLAGTVRDTWRVTVGQLGSSARALAAAAKAQGQFARALAIARQLGKED